MFHRTGKRQIGLPREMRSLSLWGKPQILLHLFVAHRILPMVDFTGFMTQKDNKIKLKQIDIFNSNDFIGNFE